MKTPFLPQKLSPEALKAFEELLSQATHFGSNAWGVGTSKSDYDYVTTTEVSDAVCKLLTANHIDYVLRESYQTLGNEYQIKVKLSGKKYDIIAYLSSEPIFSSFVHANILMTEFAKTHDITARAYRLSTFEALIKLTEFQTIPKDHNLAIFVNDKYPELLV